ncbi:hypothetical protein [Pseudoxanthomonas sp. Root630]|uniref:hypothetical protein n=1 Tax=Pseudoxanthomonas sp. Root630 TaxID=1736574 RepID=UPI0007036AA8|nr:hypothetical protein [Pseudoxanthomonas sp. Root630]KRA41941.1 hypothetical protein ASD72_15280 [Pseudoxanthomonas sp. Root630]
MTLLWGSVVVFALPLGALALVAAAAGFFYRPAQPLVLLAGAVCVARACLSFMAAGMFAHVLVLPLVVAFCLAVPASVVVRRWMEAGYRQEAVMAAAEADRMHD